MKQSRNKSYKRISWSFEIVDIIELNCVNFDVFVIWSDSCSVFFSLLLLDEKLRWAIYLQSTCRSIRDWRTIESAIVWRIVQIFAHYTIDLWESKRRNHKHLCQKKKKNETNWKKNNFVYFDWIASEVNWIELWNSEWNRRGDKTKGDEREAVDELIRNQSPDIVIILFSVSNSIRSTCCNLGECICLN